ncbi:MAG: transcription antitermination factor NusB [Planctomycetota bacterium]
MSRYYGPHDVSDDLDITTTGLKSRLAREMAMQIVFALDVEGVSRDGLAEDVTAHATATAQAEGKSQADVHGARRLAALAAKRVWEDREQTDATLERLAPQWPPKRMPAVDRAVLRLASWELLNTPTPPKVVIDEAIEIARAFSTADSSRFVNGVLDAILKEREAMIGSL